jgi:hypothetical protein
VSLLQLLDEVLNVGGDDGLVLGFPSARSEATNEGSLLLLWLLLVNSIVFPFLPLPAVFVLHLPRQRTKTDGTVKRTERRTPEGGRVREEAR